ncbi:hypothetical protein [Barnesiella sp. An55]|nr:hypothetical protein [Barnesiella sp. An55]
MFFVISLHIDASTGGFAEVGSMRPCNFVALTLSLHPVSSGLVAD